jgi:L-ascorbate metabolism protein UlaG (beta-lactamase superfamily)
MNCSAEKLYLRLNAAVEPLVDRWYAWPHLIAPANYARNLAERHLRIMRSYIASPQAHADAVRDPRLGGGPFMNFDRHREEEVAALHEQTVNKRRDLLSLSSALSDLSRLLDERAQGHSLEPLYEAVPPALRGFVELAYDLCNQPSYRLFESLLYRSNYYPPDAQSLRLHLVSDDSRPFIFSTPRLADPHTIDWHVPFDSGVVDAFFALRTEPRSFGEIADLLNTTPREQATLRSLLTTEKPPVADRYTGPAVRWKYFGHACVLIESREMTVLTDPVVSYPFAGASPRLTYANLPATIDFVLLTHSHQDHVVLETLLQLRSRIDTIVVPRNSGGALQDPSLALILRACGFKRVIELDEMEQVSCGAGFIQSIPFMGEHCDLDIRSKSGWLVATGGKSLMLMADSRALSRDLYRHVHDDTDDIDVLFVGMECDGAPLSWIYGPLLPQRPLGAVDRSRRANGSDFSSALSLVDVFRPTEVYVYAMGQEPWLQFISSIRYDERSNPIVESNRLIEAARQRGLVAERLFGQRQQILSEHSENAPRLEAAHG